MKLLIWNLKGGQGKTSLSLAIALEKWFYVLTNDVHSPIDEILPDWRALRLAPKQAFPKVPQNVDLIFDFGGYAEPRVIKAAKMVDYIIIPIIYDSLLDMQVSINAISEIEAYNKNIIIVINRTKRGGFARAKAVLDKFFTYPMFEIKQSTAFWKALVHKKSLSMIMKQNSLMGFHYAKPLRQLKALIDYIS